MFLYLVSALCISLVLYLRSYFRAVYAALKLKGPPALPILGNILLLNDRQMEESCKTAAELYGPIIRTWLTIYPVFFISEPQHIQTVIGTNRYSKKNYLYKLLQNILGDGLVTSGTAKNKKNRKLIQPVFHVNTLENFLGIFGRRSLELINSVSNKKDINITRHINMCIFRILQETVLGISNTGKEDASPFRNCEVFMFQRLLKPWLLFETMFNLTPSAKKEVKQQSEMKNYVRQIFNKRKEEWKNSDNFSDVKNLMDMFIEVSENNEEFTHEDIVNECCTLMLVGQDSVSVTTVFTLYFLAKYPEIQDKVREELQSIIGRDKMMPDLNDLNEMKYLGQCIQESMRIYPAVGTFGRSLLEDVDLGGTVLPSGATVMIAPYITHRLAHIYPEPAKYDPERFSTENMQKLHPCAYIPFSFGPRYCIGMKYAMLELKMIISMIVRSCYFELSPGHEELDVGFRVTMRAKGGVWLRFSPIENSNVQNNSNKLCS